MTQEKSEIYLKAFVELNEIINHLNTNLKNKIPKKTLEAIKNSGDKNYQFKSFIRLFSCKFRYQVRT